MLPLLAALPAIMGGISTIAGLFGGYKADQANQAAQARQDQMYGNMNGLVQQMLSGANPQAYMQQAQTVGQRMLGQVAADQAARGTLQSGTFARTSAEALSQVNADALARAQSDRQQVLGQALSAYGGLAQGYGQRINPNPYGGVGAGLGAVGNGAAWYADWQAKQGAAQPAASTGGGSLFGVSYGK